jgi:hypothetical protein
MNKKIKYIRSLIYYDYPQLFVAKDDVDLLYLCMVYDEKEDGIDYVAVPVSKKVYADYIEGLIDLRQVYESPEIDDYYYFSSSDINTETGYYLATLEGHILQEYLPDSGLFHIEDEDETSDIIQDAAKLNRSIIELRLNPPEARSNNVISSENLIDILNIFQPLLNFSFKEKVKTLAEKTQEVYESDNWSTYDVAAFKPGSFIVQFHSRIEANDLFSHSPSSLSLSVLDEMAEAIVDPIKSFEIIQNYQGHFAKKYIKLLEYILKNESPIEYTWADPTTQKYIRRKFSKNNVEKTYNELIKHEELSTENIEITGIVIKGDASESGPRTWTIKTTEGKEHKGRIDESSSLTLKSIVLTEQLYKFYCEEVIEKIKYSGQEKKTLYLIRWEKIE